MKRFATCLAVAVVACGVVMNVGLAQEKKAAAVKPPSQEEMMAAMAKMSALNENHKKLEALAGEWKADVKCWMAPGEPQVSQGSSKNEMILGGRFLKCEFAGEFMGQPFKGCHLLGYDNSKGKFFSLWLDSMNTGYSQAEGSADPSGKVLTLTSEYQCPIRNQMVKMRMVNTVLDANTHKFEMFGPPPDGSGEMKTMEITYTRAK